MFMRQACSGLPLMRTRTGSGFRQPGLIELARNALTRMYGLIPRIRMTAVKRKTAMGPANYPIAGQFSAWLNIAGIRTELRNRDRSDRFRCRRPIRARHFQADADVVRLRRVGHISFTQLILTEGNRLGHPGLR